MRKSRSDRFWEKVNKNGPVQPGMKTKCWVWTAFVRKDRYGIFQWATRDAVEAHRAAWELTHGPIPAGMNVLHACDNRTCVRHLFLGTQLDNMIDMARKGRSGQMKVGPSDVQAIRVLRSATGMTLKEIGRQFGISEGHVSVIVRGIKRKYVEAKH